MRKVKFNFNLTILRIPFLDDFPPELVLLGQTKIYLRNKMVMRLDELLMDIWKEKKEKAIKVVLQFRIYKIKQKIKEGLKTVRWRTQCFTRIQAMWRRKAVRKWYLRKREGTKGLKTVSNFLFFLFHS